MRKNRVLIHLRWLLLAPGRILMNTGGCMMGVTQFWKRNFELGLGVMSAVMAGSCLIWFLKWVKMG
ncbi:hypothetical protein Hanom_Chr05g00445951 [Helianthus anomalus]